MDGNSVGTLQLRKLADRLGKQGIILKVTDEAVDAVTDSGYDVVYGAWPLKRVIQREIENPLALQLLQSQPKDIDAAGKKPVLTVSFDGEKFIFSQE